MIGDDERRISKARVKLLSAERSLSLRTQLCRDIIDEDDAT